MTQPINPNIFKKPRPAGVPAPVEIPQQPPIPPAPPPPADTSSAYPVVPVTQDTSGNAVPNNKPIDVQNANGKSPNVTSTVPTTDQNGTKTINTIVKRPDGTSLVYDANGNLVQTIGADGQVTTGAPPSTTPSINSSGLLVDPNTGLPAMPKGVTGGSASVNLVPSPDGTGFIDTRSGQFIPNGSPLPQGATFLQGDGKIYVINQNGDKVPAGVFSSTGDVQGDAAQNNTDLIQRVGNQTSIDIANTAAAGAAGVNRLDAAAVRATNTGNQVYSDAQAASNAAIARGDAALGQATAAGNAAIDASYNAAVPLYGLGNADEANAANARNTAAAYAAATGTSLDVAAASISRLQQLSSAGDPAATATLSQFQGNNGTANQLNAFNPAANANVLNGFSASAGTAGALQGLNTTTEATQALRNTTGTAGTAADLASTPTAVSATGDLLGFQGNNGTAADLAGTNTNVSGTGALNAYAGTVGAAGGIGTNELATLDRFAGGADIGPSAAEALLQKKSDMDMGQALALARSGRGAGASANNLRTAIFENAATGQQTAADLAALRAQEAETARTQNINAAATAAGTATTLSGQKLSSLQSVQQGQISAVSNRIQALTASGEMSQKQADQVLQALTEAQTGQQKSVEDRINALVASGTMTQKQADQAIDALKAAQQGEQAAVAQKSTNLTNAGQQLQTQTAQQLDALKAQQSAELTASQQRLDAMVAAGQMTQKQADQQLAALQSAQQGQLAAETNRITAANNAATQANNSAAVNADLTKQFATLGLQYDVNSGNVFNQAGQIVMTGQQVNQQLLNTGMNAQVGQGQVSASVSNAGTQALTSLTQTSADAQKAAAALGVQNAAIITSLSQGELQQLQQIVTTQDETALRKWAAEKGFDLAQAQANAQQTGGVLSAIATIAAGAAIMLSDVNAKTDISPMGASDWFAQNGLNAPGASSTKPTTPSGGLTDAQKLSILQLSGKLGGQIGMAMSDKRSKKNKKPESFEEWLDMMPTDFRAAKGYKYKYINPHAVGAEPGEQFGPMAQDLQHTAARGAVQKMPSGMLGVDPRKTVMPMMAAVGEQQRRIDTLENAVTGLQGLLHKTGKKK